MLKHGKHYKGRATNKSSAPQDRKIKLCDIEFDEEKLRNLLVPQRKPKKWRFYDLYSDGGVESGNEFNENDSESGNGEIVKNKKKV